MSKENIDSDTINNINNNNFGNKNIAAKNIKNIDNIDIHSDDLNDLNENLKIDDFKKDLNKPNKKENLNRKINLNKDNNIESAFRTKKLNNRLIMNKREFYTINTEEDNNINKKDFINDYFNNPLRVNEVNNQNNINLNKNINNNKEMINRKPELPQLLTDLKPHEIKNELVFQKSSRNFYRKKIIFANEPNNENKKNENKNKNIIVQTPKKVINQKDINRNKFRYRLMKSELKNDDNNNDIKYSLLTEPNRKIIKNIHNNENCDNKYNNKFSNLNNINEKNISSSINNNLIDNKNKNINKNNIATVET